jgi:hypothetical protein
MKKKFSWRSFISFGLFFYFLIILFSGVILYIAPPGRIANWTDWQLIGLTKSQWQTMHTNFSYLFAILSILHLFTINWKTFWSYIKSKARTGLNRKREFYLATFITVIIFLGIVFLLPPFSSVMALGENFKEGWETENETPPTPHAEEFTIAHLASEILKVEEKDILDKLEKLGIKVESNEQTLKELAGQVDLSPQQIYNELSPSSDNVGGRIQPGSGLGRKSLQQVASENEIPLDEILTLLNQEGIEATGDDVMKDLAGKYNLNPSEILSILNIGTVNH